MALSSQNLETHSISSSTSIPLGKVRVGRLKIENKKRIYPTFPSFSPIEVMTKSDSNYWPLSPYYLKTPEGWILENDWQFSKIYSEVPRSFSKVHPASNIVVWDWPAQIHVNSSRQILPDYWNWRFEGKRAKYAVRYPTGYNHRHEVLGSILQESEDQIAKEGLTMLGYVDARKQIYLKKYRESVVKEKKFGKLKQRLSQGENLLIIEVDGPHEESMNYYSETYKVPSTFIQFDSILATEENLKLLLNDTRHPFGHGYCLASALLELNLL